MSDKLQKHKALVNSLLCVVEHESAERADIYVPKTRYPYEFTSVVRYVNLSRTSKYLAIDYTEKTINVFLVGSEDIIYASRRIRVDSRPEVIARAFEYVLHHSVYPVYTLERIERSLTASN